MIGGYNEPFGALTSDTKDHHCAHCLIGLKDNIFAPKVFYIASGCKPIVFDSGCTIEVNSHLEDFAREANKVKKEITELSSIVQVEGECNVNWSFYDDYGVIQNVKIKTCYTPSSPVSLFSPQYYLK